MPWLADAGLRVDASPMDQPRSGEFSREEKGQLNLGEAIQITPEKIAPKLDHDLRKVG